jgi:hypothetical protein
MKQTHSMVQRKEMKEVWKENSCRWRCWRIFGRVSPRRERRRKVKSNSTQLRAPWLRGKERARTLLTGCRKMKRETTMIVLAYGARQN